MKKYDNNSLNKELAGKTIKFLTYISDEESKLQDFSNTPISIVFTDGSRLVPLANDRFNNGGSLYVELNQEVEGRPLQFYIPSKEWNE
jgi:hypothetical protein